MLCFLMGAYCAEDLIIMSDGWGLGDLVDELRAENERLRATLAHYGRHDQKCGHLIYGKCSCGFHEALANGGCVCPTKATEAKEPPLP